MHTNNPSCDITHPKTPKNDSGLKKTTQLSFPKTLSSVGPENVHEQPILGWLEERVTTSKPLSCVFEQSKVIFLSTRDPSNKIKKQTKVTLFTPKHDLFAPPCKMTTGELSFYNRLMAETSSDSGSGVQPLEK